VLIIHLPKAHSTHPTTHPPHPPIHPSITETVDLNDWVQNALQLSGFYIEHNAFAMARYYLEAVRALLEQRVATAAGGNAAGKIARQQTSGDAAAVMDSSGSPVAATATKLAAGGAEAPSAAAANDGEAVAEAHASMVVARDVDSDTVVLTAQDTADGRRRVDQEPPAAAAAGPVAAAAATSAATGSETAAAAAAAARLAVRDELLTLLEEDVAANVRLAWGKLFLYRLVAAHDQNLLGRAAGGGVFDGPESVPAAAR